MIGFTQRVRRLAAVAAVLVTAAACQDLAVVNTNLPDRDRALSDPADLEVLISAIFDAAAWDALSNDTHARFLWPPYATEMTANGQGGTWTQAEYPRPAFDNSASIPVDGGNLGSRNFQEEWQQVASIAADGLRILDAGTIVLEEEAQSRAFAKFMQGMAWGELAMMYDRVIVIGEDQEIESDAEAQARANLIPWEEARDAAFESLDAALAIVQQNNITYPAFTQNRLYFGTPNPIDPAQFAKMVNTLKARWLVYAARTKEERQTVDWNAVLQYTAAGLDDQDWEVQLDPDFRNSALINNQQSTNGGSAQRYDQNLIGWADASGNYQEFLAAPIVEKDRFDITTGDRRLTGVDEQGNPDPQAPGAYAIWLDHNNGFPEARGSWRRSAYRLRKHYLEGFSSNTGTHSIVSVDENRLLRAEALMRTGNLQGAADLINVTRTRQQLVGDVNASGVLEGVLMDNLPPVTVDGVPEGEFCVPRHENGDCGDLMVALRWERMFELAGMTITRGYWDGRGFGILFEDTMTQAPVPGYELEVIGEPFYTHGGPGGAFSAVYAPATMADL